MKWEKDTEEKLKHLINKVPAFMRSIALDKITNKSVALAQAAQREEVIEKDLIDAFFAETPFGFHGPMKSDMDGAGIDYKQYGHE